MVAFSLTIELNENGRTRRGRKEARSDRTPLSTARHNGNRFTASHNPACSHQNKANKQGGVGDPGQKSIKRIIQTLGRSLDSIRPVLFSVVRQFFWNVV
ncbi:hypothetical protein BaRGS_00009024 [Batillaria attramentaria]|uniref:Uncharacterized protein n=1 Tax=Batillaria attramentaria TaxID=370345 RepID=A0ABD0LKR0_9CAEN